jgi:ParB family chromosome partitioning protein
MSTPKIKKGLGRGLDALFGDEENSFENDASRARPAAVPENAPANAAPSRLLMNVSQMVPGSFQPRQHFDEEALEQLAASIRTHGLLQPILVRRDAKNPGTYEIIAGERRWRAAQKAQLHEVPVIITALGDTQAAEVALIENLQREDLNAVEEALGYKRLSEEYGHTQEKLAEALGKSRPHIANTMRLLQLPGAVLDYVRAGKLSAGHARALITSKDPAAMAREVIEKGLSVRKTEELVTNSIISRDADAKLRKQMNPGKDADTIACEDDLGNVLGMKVTITPKGKAEGVLAVAYKNLDQLDDLMLRLARFPDVRKAE